MKKNKLNLNQMVQRRLDDQGLDIGEFAKRLNLTYSGTWQLMKADDYKVGRLATITDALQYNFFRELAELFPYHEPSTQTKEAAAATEALHKHIANLELEIRVLKEAISLMRG